jgi:hypothetical protein
MEKNEKLVNYLLFYIFSASMKIYDEIKDCNMKTHPLVLETLKNVMIGIITKTFLDNDASTIIFMIVGLWIPYVADIYKSKSFYCLDKTKHLSFDDDFWYGMIVYTTLLFFIYLYNRKENFQNMKKTLPQIISLIIISILGFVFLYFDVFHFEVEYSNNKMLFRMFYAVVFTLAFYVSLFFENYMCNSSILLSLFFSSYFFTWIFMKCMFHNEPGVELEDIERVKEMFMTPCL